MILSLALTAILAIQNTNQSATSQRPVISVTLSSVSTVIKLGSEIRLKIVVTNTSDHDLHLRRSIGKDQGEFLNRFEVYDEQGNAAVKTKYYKDITGEKIENEEPQELYLNFAGSLLKPGESLNEEVILNKLYVFDKPGKYTIQVEHEDPETKTLIKSNTVIRTLTP